MREQLINWIHLYVTESSPGLETFLLIEIIMIVILLFALAIKLRFKK